MSERLDAGRALNERVAEIVMGWPRIGDSESFARFLDYGGVITSSGPEFFGSVGVIPKPWRPSTEIASAFLVVEKMRERKWALSLHYEFGKSNQWVADFTQTDDDDMEVAYSGEELSQNPAHCICLAALAALAAFSGEGWR